MIAWGEATKWANGLSDRATRSAVEIRGALERALHNATILVASGPSLNVQPEQGNEAACSTCKGKGVIPLHDNADCPDCGGKGFVPQPPSLDGAAWVRIFGQHLQRLRDGAIADSRGEEYDDGKVFAYEVALAMFAKMAPLPPPPKPEEGT